MTEAEAVHDPGRVVLHRQVGHPGEREQRLAAALGLGVRAEPRLDRLDDVNDGVLYPPV